jgi:hypothetical protein
MLVVQNETIGLSVEERAVFFEVIEQHSSSNHTHYYA